MLKLQVLEGVYAVCRFEPGQRLPEWTAPGLEAELHAVLYTPGEVSVVCREARLPSSGVRAERGFAALRVEGPLDFSLIGVLARLTEVLAEAGVSVFALSSFDTDTLLVRADKLETAAAAFRTAGIPVRDF